MNNNRELARSRIQSYHNRGKVIPLTQKAINGRTAEFTKRAVVTHKDFSWLARIRTWIRSWIENH